jgi:hypothetical protein
VFTRSPNFFVVRHEFGRTTQIFVGQHEFGWTTHNWSVSIFVGQHKIQSDNTKFSRTTQNSVGQHKIQSDNTKLGKDDTKFVQNLCQIVYIITLLHYYIV